MTITTNLPASTADAALTESTSLRARHMDRTDVLAKVKALILLADDVHATTDLVASYFEVDVETIKKLVQRHRAEVSLNGYRVVRGADIKGLAVNSRAKALALYKRRTVLNVAMLLHSSPTAQQVRLELLNAATNTYAKWSPSPAAFVDDRHVYVIEFSSGVIKVGQTRDLARREMDHEQGAQNHGHFIVRSWATDAHADWKANEQALIDFCTARFGSPIRGREYFAGTDFGAVVEFAGQYYAEKYARPMFLELGAA